MGTLHCLFFHLSEQEGPGMLNISFRAFMNSPQTADLMEDNRRSLDMNFSAEFNLYATLET
jgi:hypothetical protein